MARKKKETNEKELVRGVYYVPEDVTEDEEAELVNALFSDDDKVDELTDQVSEIVDSIMESVESKYKAKAKKTKSKKEKISEVVDKVVDSIENLATPKKKRVKKEKVEEVKVVEEKATEVEETTTDDDLDEIINFYDPQKAAVDLAGLASLSKETKTSVATVTDKQIVLIVDNYYQTQRYRMNIANQIRAVSQGFDDVQEGETPAIAWLLADVKNRENQIKLMIQEYANHNPVCQWAMGTKGIGPVFAANLWGYIDMSKCHHANQFISYAGLNDNNAPWLGKVKATEIVNKVYEELGLSDKDDANDDVYLRVAIASGRNVLSIKRGFLSHKEKETKKTHDKTIMIKFLSKPPYNTELKKVCYLIGESFCKVSNRGSLYGELYKERKALETFKNENLEYKEQAERLLKEKNYSKDTETYKYLSQGKLSPAHITARAKRYAVKIFLTHFFEACYIYTHKKNPPTIYPIAHQGHVDYIKPESPYEEFFVWDNN